MAYLHCQYEFWKKRSRRWQRKMRFRDSGCGKLNDEGFGESADC